MTLIDRRSMLCALPVALAASTWPQFAAAAGPHLRFATLVPRGSLYHRVLQEACEGWRLAEGPGAAATIFTDGVQGDEVDVVRRMRIGQLNGAMISVVGLCAIAPEAAALQFMPMVFRSWDEFDAAARRLRPLLEQRIAERGFVVLYWGEAGWVRFFSKVPVLRPADLQHTHIYAWSGSDAQVELMRTLGYHPVVLETADILPGLQTGLIDVVPLITNWALAAQVDLVAPHMLDMRWAPVVGAAVITRQAWEAMSPAGQAAMRQAARQASMQLRAERERADQAAVDAMRRRGLTVHVANAEQLQEWVQLATQAYPRIRGGMVPPDVFDIVQQSLAEFRAGRTVS
jgi:TRAP-type C4-dicarboxylate transport system substrate-binding protein